jgi:hypothetical protein
MESQPWRYHRSSEPWVPNVGVNPLGAPFSTLDMRWRGSPVFERFSAFDFSILF